MLTAGQERELLAAAGPELQRMDAAGPVVLEIMPSDAYIMVSQMQLALRHPMNKGHKRLRALRVIDSLIDLLSEPGTRLRELLELGNKPEYDS